GAGRYTIWPSRNAGIDDGMPYSAGRPKAHCTAAAATSRQPAGGGRRPPLPNNSSRRAASAVCAITAPPRPPVVPLPPPKLTMERSPKLPSTRPLSLPPAVLRRKHPDHRIAGVGASLERLPRSAHEGAGIDRRGHGKLATEHHDRRSRNEADDPRPDRGREAKRKPSPHARPPRVRAIVR